MSTEEVVTSRKAKKAQRDAERKKAGRKRKRGEDGEEGGTELKEDDFIPLAGGDEMTIAPSTDELSKKRKVAADSDETSTAPKVKKRRKAKPASTDAGHEASATADDAAAASKSSGNKSRFILFIGNLPFSATDATITAHFKSIQPFTLRHRVDPKTKKSKGFAFLEFENYDRMKTCLKLYHHSVFDPEDAHEGGVGGEQKGGKKKKDKSRKINVELTAGGGGKGEERKEKIKLKNAKLEEERKRRREAEEKAAARKAKKLGLKKTGANAEGKKEESVEKGGEEEGEGMQGVHPARLARMKT